MSSQNDVKTLSEPERLSSLESNKKKGYVLDKMTEHRRNIYLAKLRNKKSKTQRVYTYLKKKTYAGVIASLPELHTDPNRFHERAFCLGLVFIVFSVSFFITALVLQYSTIRDTITLQPIEQNQPVPQGCIAVESTLNLNAKFDQNGNWETSGSFQVEKSLYEASFVSVMANKANYSVIMTALKGKVNAVRSFGATSTLALYYAAFGTFQKEVSSADLPGILSVTSKIGLQTITSPKYMFNGATNFFSITLVSANYTETQNCQKKVTPIITNLDGVVTITYKNAYQPYQGAIPYAAALCKNILDPALFYMTTDPAPSYIDTFDASVAGINSPNSVYQQKISFASETPPDIVFTVDMTSMLVAVAVNMGILDMADLAKIDISSFFGFPEYLAAYILPRYPSMQVIICNPTAFTGDSATIGSALCFAYLGSPKSGIFALPVMTSISSMPLAGIPYGGLCMCENGESVAKYGLSVLNDTAAANLCSTKSSMLMSLVGIGKFVDTQQDKIVAFKSAYQKLFSYVDRVVSDSSLPRYAKFMNLVYNASATGQFFIESHVAQDRKYPNGRPKELIKSYLIDSFSFCDKECFVMVVTYYGLTSSLAANAVNFVSSDVSLSFPCTTKPFPTDAAWAQLISTPPVPLVQEYAKCQISKDKAFATALGLANGLLHVAMAACALVLLPAIIYLMEVLGYIHPVSKLGDEYNAEDKRLVIEELALQLLRVRDNDVRGLNRGGALEMLGHDLINTAKATAKLDGGEEEADIKSGSSKASLQSRVSARVFLDIEGEEGEESARNDLDAVLEGRSGANGDSFVFVSGTNPMQLPKNAPHDQL